MRTNIMKTESLFDFDLLASIHNAKRFAIVTTDCCQANCSHCLMMSGPKRKEMLTLDQIVKALDYVINHTSVEIIVFTGGESTLLGDNLLEAISYCAIRDVPTRLVTNAAWANDGASAERVIRDLRDAGLTEINYSTDDFHRIWIPFENIKTAWNASKNKGFATVLIAICGGPMSNTTPQTVMELLNEEIAIIHRESDLHENLPPAANDGTRYFISQTEISRLGRGIDLPDEYFPSYEDFENSKVYGSCPNLMNPVTLNADGTLGVCCGINTEYNSILSLGNMRDILYDQTFSINDFQGFLLSAIQKLGPAYLYHIATKSATGIVKMRARSACEVCNRLTTDEKLLDTLKERRGIVEQQMLYSDILKKLLK